MKSTFCVQQFTDKVIILALLDLKHDFKFIERSTAHWFKLLYT